MAETGERYRPRTADAKASAQARLPAALAAASASRPQTAERGSSRGGMSVSGGFGAAASPRPGSIRTTSGRFRGVGTPRSQTPAVAGEMVRGWSSWRAPSPSQSQRARTPAASAAAARATGTAAAMQQSSVSATPVHTPRGRDGYLSQRDADVSYRGDFGAGHGLIAPSNALNTKGGNRAGGGGGRRRPKDTAEAFVAATGGAASACGQRLDFVLPESMLPEAARWKVRPDHIKARQIRLTLDLTAADFSNEMLGNPRVSVIARIR